MDKSPRIFASNAGQEFVMVIANVPQLIKHEKNLRQLLLSYKKRDFIDKTKRSVFYTMMLNVLIKMNKLDQFNALDLLSTTSADLAAKD